MNTKKTVPEDETLNREFQLPPVLRNEKGDYRKIGFEIEFSGVSSSKVAELIRSEFGGTIEKKNRYYINITGSSPGDFTVKIDTSFLYEKKYRKLMDLFGLDLDKFSDDDDIVEKAEEVLENVFATVVPYEIAAPPVEITNMATIDRVRQLLNDNRAEGTKVSAYYAFALHINPELPSLTFDCLFDYLKAFLLLYPWLKKVMAPDYTRRLTTFINPFPDTYSRLALDPEYKPAFDTFIKDYHYHNPDRNRPLDLYPALAMLDESVSKLKGIGNVSKRPTLHFRMPDSRIDQAGWTLATEWNNWNYVERLAASKD
ncbi:MAG TPA: amidoligase family protein, partial [Bacteroidales bacterium]|nr:amidoligase family protein [Bacteroidales bacterium]